MNTFQEVIKVKVDKDNNTCHLSIKTSPTKVEVFKVSISDVASLISQFRSQMSVSGKKNNLTGKLIK
tara:strand:- start:177 stop:377 length:201 start_codon:yes stop_codon:yes gene_type:complete